MNLYLIRHGQTDWNVMKKMQGTEDIPLNDEGRTQAEACAQALSLIPFEAIYTSPLSRARETAQIISARHGHTPVIVEPGLTERDFGEGSGMTYHEFHSTYPEYPTVLPKGMEAPEQLRSRVCQAVRSCAEKHRNTSILLISHGASINAFLYQISDGICGSGITRLKNTGISKLSYCSVRRQFSLLYHNLSPEEFLCTAIQ